jgi:hypothetical protein
MVLGSGIRDPKSGIRNPGSGKNLFRIPDPGVKKAPDPGSRIRNTGEGEGIGLCGEQIHELYSVYLTRFRTYKIALPPKTKT